MHFTLIDDVLEETDDQILAIKHVSRAEEYLADHFPGFPILPGVFMLEVMVQAARRLLAARSPRRLVLGEVKALKYGAMVRPGQTLEVEVRVVKEADGETFSCRGTGRVRGPGESDRDADATAVSGRFTMRPVHEG